MTNADHVVVVTPTSIVEVPPSPEEVERGEGKIGRTATFTVDQVLWSADTPEKGAPTNFKMPVAGWQFTDGDTNKRTELALHDQPRIESGHSYIVTIDWVEQYCEPGDNDYIAAHWDGLGSDSVIPFDGGVIGQGELEGGKQSVKQARGAIAADDPDYSLEDEMAGKGSDALTAELLEASPEPARAAPESMESTDCG
ncbi:hypothetical protein [Streptomyces sp. NPDC051218]|uniref:hypothetical protein n=1 Tax=Streptomyces sp. NPDC051218 TaxID=3365645 RepID=UPI0037BD3D64